MAGIIHTVRGFGEGGKWLSQERKEEESGWQLATLQITGTNFFDLFLCNFTTAQSCYTAFISIKEAYMFEFSFEEIEKLTTQFQNLRTFEEVADWDYRAKQAVESIVGLIRNTQTEKAQIQSSLTQLQNDHEDKNFFSKVLGGKKELNQLEGKINKIDILVSKFESLINDIQSKIDITPNTPEEQTTLLKELFLEKKELTVKKREINAQMKEIRTAARQQSVNSTDSLVGVIAGSKYRAAARRDIRYQKEQMLNPHENEKTYIERQLLQIEKDILWVERFKYLNPPQSNVDLELS